MSEIRLAYPLVIGPTLEPAVKIGDVFVSLDLSTLEFTVSGMGTVSDIRPPMVRQSDDELVRGMFSALFGFLGAYAESLPDGENADLFPAEFADWAIENSDEFGMLEFELEN